MVAGWAALWAGSVVAAEVGKLRAATCAVNDDVAPVLCGTALAEQSSCRINYLP